VIDFDVKGRTALITINRPEARNAVNGEVAQGLESAIDRLESDSELWAGVLTGAGTVFCAGADLGVIARGHDREMFTQRGGFGGFVRLPRTKPMIAAVDGPALAGGFELALACDLIVASTNARFGLPEVKRSLVAAAGGLVRLPRILPQQTALRMLLTGDPIDAEIANRHGLVSELVDPGRAVDSALHLADRINANAPLAVRETRRLALISVDSDPEVIWKASRQAMRDLSHTEDFKEGPRAFLEKRSAVWQGR
jgi:enoyl-CoA hydratase